MNVKTKSSASLDQKLAPSPCLSARQKSLVWIYLTLCSAILLSVGWLGVSSPERLVPLLETGGSIESGAAIFYLGAAILSVRLGIVSRHSSRRLPKARAWFSFAGFNLFLIGEEASWGTEPVLGWQLLPSEAHLFSEDLHDALPHVMAALLQQSAFSRLIVLSLLWLILVAAIAFLFCYFRPKLSSFKGKPQSLSIHQRFVCIGLVLLTLSVIDIPESFGASYIKGQWALEETGELIAGLTFLFGALLATCTPSRSRTTPS